MESQTVTVPVGKIDWYGIKKSLKLGLWATLATSVFGAIDWSMENITVFGEYGVYIAIVLPVVSDLLKRVFTTYQSPKQ